MTYTITNINLRFEDGQFAGANVYFTGRDDEKTITVSGTLPLTVEEYDGKTYDELLAIVAQKVAEKTQVSPTE